MGVCLSGRERVEDHVHGEGGDKGRQKTTATRTMTQAGSKQQPVEGEAQSGWITTWQGGGCRIGKERG